MFVRFRINYKLYCKHQSSYQPNVILNTPLNGSNTGCCYFMDYGKTDRENLTLNIPPNLVRNPNRNLILTINLNLTLILTSKGSRWISTTKFDTMFVMHLCLERCGHEQASFCQASPGRLAVLLQAVQEG